MTVGKWYTCTPVAFKGDHTFFHRDSGLFCKAFQEIGVESKAVMPLPSQEGDWPDLIRTEYKNLESADWWKSLKLDGVVLYAWTLTKYTPVARAIHKSGAKLVLYFDAGASIYPWHDWLLGTKLIFRVQRFKHHNTYVFWALLSVFKAHTITIANYLLRRRHINYADLIGIPTPYAVSTYKRVPFLMTKKSRSRIQLVANPIASHFKYDHDIPKEDRVIAVGRWDDEEPKRPRYMMEAIEKYCSDNPSTHFDIFGFVPDFMIAWHRSLRPESQKRIHIHGIVKSPELANFYQRARICLCPSIHEGTHLASAEAICCGCSIVVSPSPFVSAVHWYASAASGTVAEHDTPASFAQALADETALWKTGKRDPISISSHWARNLHATSTATTIIKLMSTDDKTL